jgi:hypothetical protein
MAHGDYDCCAVCDSKLRYSFDAQAKETICGHCLLKMQKMGLGIVTVKQLIEWITNTDKEILRDKLLEMGFYKCFYDDNQVDQAALKRGIKFYNDGRVNPED